jgi:chloramphenicol 3-O-phosphotransferase
MTPTDRDPLIEPTATLITGVQSSGKSTVGRMLAERLTCGAFIEGDDLWQMVVSGREDMADPPSEAALEQLELRYRHGAMLSQSFVDAGIHAVHVDNIYGPAVIGQLHRVTCRRALVVLRPTVEAIVERELRRGTNAYGAWRMDGSLVDAVRRFDGWLAETPSIGLWVDSTGQSAQQTVDWVLEHWDQALVP